MKIQFIGAAKTVTGSMHLIEVNGKKFLLDCGLYQGKRKIAFEINRTFEYFDPGEIDFVILSHAHIDHSGNLPTLVRKGFKGNIYSTFATKDLCAVMLQDSGHIQEKDVEWVNRKRIKQHKNPFEPLYTVHDAVETLNHFVGINYHREFEITEGIKVTFFDAGHILGSASILLKITEEGKTTLLGFTGDLGRPNLAILKDPEKLPDVDYLITESTYGGRKHDNPKDSEDVLARVVNKAVERKGKIIIPAFSVGRTQELVFAFNNIFTDKRAEEIPVYVDSPLSVNATEVFRVHPECFDNETAEYIVHNRDPFGFNKLHYISEVEDSKRLNEIGGPMIIISSSGMVEAGRILHHLRNNIGNPNNIILMVGYSAQHTLGRRLIEREPVVKIFGEEFEVKAEVIVMNSFSAHADKDELLSYADKFDKSRMQRIFIVHGDEDQQKIFYGRLKSIGFKYISIPEKGDVFVI
ncbi:MAG: MBL fold metallo-hydrolase [Chlorobi bacterium]|nr:MBL fold metallo-hydrolase [Chlorobiota bacterium]